MAKKKIKITKGCEFVRVGNDAHVFHVTKTQMDDICKHLSNWFNEFYLNCYCGYGDMKMKDFSPFKEAIQDLSDIQKSKITTLVFKISK